MVRGRNSFEVNFSHLFSRLFIFLQSEFLLVVVVALGEPSRPGRNETDEGGEQNVNRRLGKRQQLGGGACPEVADGGEARAHQDGG
jgi:hypothetical protein